MGLRQGMLQPIAQLNANAQVEQLFWHQVWGGGGSYFLIPPG